MTESGTEGTTSGRALPGPVVGWGGEGSRAAPPRSGASGKEDGGGYASRAVSPVMVLTMIEGEGAALARLGLFSSLPGADADRFGEMGWDGVRGKSGPAVGPDDSVTVSNGLARRLLLLLEPGWVERPTSRVSPSGGVWLPDLACNGAFFRGARRSLWARAIAQTQRL